MTHKSAITIRGRQTADWEDIYDIMQYNEVARESDRLPYPSPEAIREQDKDTLHLVAEVTRLDGFTRVAGTLAMCTNTWPRLKHLARLRLAVHPHYQAQDIGDALVRAAIDLADNWLGLRRLQAEIYAGDEAALALYKRLGFQLEATRRRCIIRDGAFADAFLMGRINESLGGRRKPDTPSEAITFPERPPQRPLVTVRAQRDEDWEDLYALFTAPGVFANTLGIPYRKFSEVQQRVTDIPDNLYPLVAEVDERVVGAANVRMLAGRRAHVASLGMMVYPDYPGMGIGTALMQAAVDLTGRWAQTRRLELNVFPDNLRAIALYEKFDFEHEGRIRDYSFQNGAYIDTLMMSRLFD